MDNTSRPWGENFIHLKLPTLLVTIKGLTGNQKRLIAQDYKSFVASLGKNLQNIEMICHAFKLDQPLTHPMKVFTVNGQYTPRKHRLDGGIQITGFNFMGHFIRDGSEPKQSYLAVNKQNEFSSVLVLENFLRILTAYHVLDQGGVLLHSAGIVYQKKAYLFCGRSNAGKTTLTRKADAAGFRVLSDDINLVIPENGEYCAHKVPFTGEFGRRAENLSGCGSFPIGGLALLEKAPELTAAPVTPAMAMAGLLTGCPFVNDDPEEMPVLMNVLTNLLLHKPVIRMGVAKDDSFETIMAEFLRSSESG